MNDLRWKFGNLDMTDSTEKAYRNRTCSVETGYQTGDPTPLQTPIKNQFQFSRLPSFNADFQLEPPDCIQEENSDVFNETIGFDESIDFNPNTTVVFRPITKKSEVKEIDADLDRRIWAVAEQLIDFRMDLYERGLGLDYLFPEIFPNNSIPQRDQSQSIPDGGLRHVMISKLPGSPKSRRYRKKKPQPTCEFCRNNNSIGWEDHACKNELGEVVCPILSKMICPKCGSSGKRAHTKRYCPQEQRKHQRSLELTIKAGNDMKF